MFDVEEMICRELVGVENVGGCLWVYRRKEGLEDNRQPFATSV